MHSQRRCYSGSSHTALSGSVWCAGTYRYGTPPVMEEVKGLIAQGKATLQAKPAEYQGMWFQTSMEGWPDDQQVSAALSHLL